MKQRNWFFTLFTAVMLCTILVLVWYLPSVSVRTFQLRDLQLSLETSQGRERKQQYEYDKVVSEIPALQAEIDAVLPRTEAAEQEVADLKAERKKLRNEKKKLEKQLSGGDQEGGSENE